MIKYLGQWIKNRVWKPVLPLELIFFVTGRCNFRCKHCFIDNFAIDPSTELSLEVVEQLAYDLPQLAVLMVTGGEPFLREDLAEFVRIFSVKSHPKVISIATNGFFTSRIVKTIEQIVNLPEFHSQLIITLSFEGTESTHDNNRRCKGAYQKAILTAQRLRELQSGYHCLMLGANITLTLENEQDILIAARELARMNLFSFLSQNIYREKKPYSACTSLDLEIYCQLSQFVHQYSKEFIMSGNSVLGKWHFFKEQYQAEIIKRLCQRNIYLGIPCEAGRGIGVIYYDGRVAPCELLPADWGNIKEQNFLQIWNASVNREYSDMLRDRRCFCTHECFISASLNLQLLPMLSCLKWNLLKRIMTG